MSSIKSTLTTNYSCYGAYYNQVASHIAATTRDDHVMTFSLANLSETMNYSKRISHRNYVNRFVTPFAAQPHARFESYFLIGSANHPREVKLTFQFEFRND